MANEASSEPIESAGTMRASSTEAAVAKASRPGDSESDADRARIKARLFGDEESSGGTGAGTVLADRYRLDEPLGQGGMGAVWKGTHLSLKSPIAIKLIDPKLAGTDEARARFVREAQSAASLRGANVVQILDYGVHDERIPYIVMELLEGEALSARLKAKGVLTPEEAVPFIIDIARAIGRAHDNGVVHRDLKPDNVFIVAEGDREVCKVLDFGIAKAADAGTLTADGSTPTQTGAILGTPHYMSPEQAENSKDVDHRTDLWALGVITYQMLLGERPFQGETITQLVLKICTAEVPVPSEHRDDLGPDFDTWFSIACSRDIDARFDSAREMGEALREAFGMPTEGGATSSRLAATKRASEREARRSPAVFILAGLVGAGAIGGLALGFSGGDPPQPPPAVDKPGLGVGAKTGPQPPAVKPLPKTPKPEVAALEVASRAKARLELMDHAGAASLLEGAYASLAEAPPSPGVEAARKSILLDLVEAKASAYEASNDVADLQRAHDLIDKAVSDGEASAADDPEGHAALEARRDELAAKLETATAEKAPEPAPKPRPKAPRAKTKKPDPKPVDAKKKPDLEF